MITLSSAVTVIWLVPTKIYMVRVTWPRPFETTLFGLDRQVEVPGTKSAVSDCIMLSWRVRRCDFRRMSLRKWNCWIYAERRQAPSAAPTRCTCTAGSVKTTGSGVRPAARRRPGSRHSTCTRPLLDRRRPSTSSSTATSRQLPAHCGSLLKVRLPPVLITDITSFSRPQKRIFPPKKIGNATNRCSSYSKMSPKSLNNAVKVLSHRLRCVTLRRHRSGAAAT